MAGIFRVSPAYGIYVDSIVSSSGSIPSFSYPITTAQELDMTSGFDLNTSFTFTFSGTLNLGIGQKLAIYLNSTTLIGCNEISATGVTELVVNTVYYTPTIDDNLLITVDSGWPCADITTTTSTTAAPGTTTTTTAGPTTTTTTTPFSSSVSLTNQPNEYGISMARSPILYRYTGCNSGASYSFYLLLSTGTTAGLTTYVEITRKSNTANEIIVDASVLIKNYLKNIIKTEQENITYFKSVLIETIGIFSGTTTSNIGIATLGYTNYNNGLNYTDETTAVDYIMNYYSENNVYPILNYTGNTSITWRDSGVNTGYKITYTTNLGATGTEQASFPSQTSALNEVYKINCGYKDLTAIDIDYSQPLKVQIMNGTSVVKTYNFSAIYDNCNTANYLKYINRWGIWDRIYFQGRKDTEAKVDYETFKYINTDNFNYNVKDGLYHKIITSGKVKTILNTGWISELYNTQLKDLLLSEYVLLNDSPVIITDKDIRFKTHRFEKMINYVITVENAFDEINNII